MASILDHPEVDRLIKLSLEEDEIQNDLTVQASRVTKRSAHAKVIAKAPTVAAGFPLVGKVIAAAGLEIQANSQVAEGAALQNGDVWFTLDGNAGDILRVERTILNFLLRSCGIATATHSVVNEINHTQCKVLHTRKTAPGHRRTDIYAAITGGAHAHRRSLGDAILVKENHLRSAKSFQDLFDGINELRSKAGFVEIEVTNLTELKLALPAKPDRIMLDNFTVEEVEKAVMLFGSSVQLEASGGINLKNAKAYAETGVDYISMGWITHSAPAADLSMLFEVSQ